ncbi:hypothetical protein FPV67DRAFT_1671424 [Lyophyllum atratum]|nr:hypothetical protein FPV67DRAFT_1671424 [Lyophyllum atratum]
MNKLAVGEPKPCGSSSETAEALQRLVAALQAAADAADQIRLPVRVEGTRALGWYSLVETADLPQQMRDMCDRLGYLVLQETTSPREAPSDDRSVPQEESVAQEEPSDTVSSSSTDWMEEFSVSPSDIPADMAPAVATSPVPPPPQAVAHGDHVVNENRWYAVIVGRNPGVHRGSYHVGANTSGIPGGFAQRYASELTAQAAYNAALASGSVYRVTFDMHRERLGAPPGPPPPPPPPSAGAV